MNRHLVTMLREEAGLSNRALRTVVGCTDAELNAWEAGLTPMPDTVRVRLEQLLQPEGLLRSAVVDREARRVDPAVAWRLRLTGLLFSTPILWIVLLSILVASVRRPFGSWTWYFLLAAYAAAGVRWLWRKAKPTCSSCGEPVAPTDDACPGCHARLI